MTPWWEMWPGRFEYELSELESAGFVIDRENAQDGLRHLTVQAPDQFTGVGSVMLQISFPDTYPRTAPHVTAPELDLPHHQHPFGHTLCLIGRGTQYWDSGSTLADLLQTQLPQAIAAGSGAAGEHNEIQQGEPFATYYAYTEGVEALIETDGTDVAPGHKGDVTLRVTGKAPPIPVGAQLKLCVERIVGGDFDYRASEPLKEMMRDAAQVSGRWVVLDEPVRVDDAETIWRAAALADPRDPPAWDIAGGTGISFRLVGFPDETAMREKGTGWVLAMRQRGQLKIKKSRSGNPATRNQQSRTPDSYHLGRVNRAGPSDMLARSPQTRGLMRHSALVIGSGAIGSVLIEHLARAGLGQVHIIDKDHLEPGNLVRHAATMAQTGLPKSFAMAIVARSVNPFIEASGGLYTIGQPGNVEGRTVMDILTEAVASVDLVIDASAEVGIQEVTADVARQTGRPWLGMSASEGAAGGSVVLVPADADWCHACYQWHRVDETIPFPVAVDDDPVQPVGCAEPTFIGAGFDLAEVSLHAARVATATLLRDDADGYPDDDYDAYVLTLREASGARTLPRWDGYTVTRHDQCAGH